MFVKSLAASIIGLMLGGRISFNHRAVPRGRFYGQSGEG